MAAKSLIEPAPAFSTDDLWQTASDDWITNGGSTSNQRYSSLDEINDGNVQNLRGVWLTHLRKSGLAAKYSAESQPLEYQGVIYVPTGQDDVFAVSADTGEILWEVQGAPPTRRSRSSAAAGRAAGSRSATGRCTIGQLDGSLVALGSGRPARSPGRRQVARWQDGYSVTAAPLYIQRDGRPPASRRRVRHARQRHRLRHDDGGPEVALLHDSPAQVRPATTRGRSRTTPGRPGAPPSGSTPSVDPELGTAVLHDGQRSVPTTTGQLRAPARTCSPRRWSRSTCRPGKLQVVVTRWCTTTSEELRHASPTILFDGQGERQGREGDRRGREDRLGLSAEPRTGKPLFPTPEQKVPQEVNQKTGRRSRSPRTSPSSRTRFPTRSTGRC